ncbi:MarR family transcriptional regulator [Fulvivirgaceae bacterium BMA10]|uniref:MarR family transcriptional regulator n=1 Tax=Splendidivirga corallicola TaxID=3051826 RepID=A0ABT8KNZ9_9BACT|nr:MarR family transcriptional regulator [Fulvivirgaceae bacterium BMA10]
MAKSIFDPKSQEKDIKSKIVIGLERISEAFRVLLWEHAKVIGLSPIQIQILIFIAHHKEALCNVSQIAREFNVTKPTISDAIKVLETKGFIIKKSSSYDSRSYSISLSDTGKNIVKDTEGFADPIKNQLSNIENDYLENLYDSLTQLIYGLNKTGIITVQRTCYGCRFYERRAETHHCQFLRKDLLNSEIRLDCSEFETKAHG